LAEGVMVMVSEAFADGGDCGGLDWRGLCFIQIAAEAWRCVEQ